MESEVQQTGQKSAKRNKMTDLEKAKQILDEENCTLVLCNGDDIYKTDKKGLEPVIECIESGNDYWDWTACDKVVGRAAAFLYVLLGVKEVHAKVMAKLAIQILDKAEIKYSTDLFVNQINSPDGKTIHPLEDAVLRSGSANNALRDIKAYLASH